MRSFFKWFWKTFVGRCLRLPLDLVLLTMDWVLATSDFLFNLLPIRKKKACRFCDEPEYRSKSRRVCTGAAKYVVPWFFKGICPCVLPPEKADGRPYCTNPSSRSPIYRRLPITGLLLLGIWISLIFTYQRLEITRHVQEAKIRFEERQAKRRGELTENEKQKAADALQTAQSAIAANDSTRAKAALLTVLEYNPAHAEAHIQLAETYRQDLDYAKAWDHAQQGRNAGGQSTRLEILLAHQEYHIGLADAALTRLRAIPWPSDAPVEIRYHAAELHAQLKDLDGARELLNQALVMDPDRIKCHLALINIHMLKGERSEARNLLADLLHRHPDHPELLLKQEELRFKDDRGALVNMKKLAERFPDQDAIRLRYAIACMESGKLGEALIEATTLAQSPEIQIRFTAAWLRSTIYFERQLFSDAMQAINDATAIDPTDTEVRFLKARIHRAMDETYRAIEIMVDLEKLRPSNLDYRIFTIHCLETLKRKPEALAALEKTQRDFPDQMTLVIRLSNRYIEAERKEDAQALIRTYLATHPDTPLLQNNLAHLLADTEDQLDEAASLGRSLRTKFPADPLYADTYGWVLVRQGRATEALPHLQMAVRGIPHNPEILYHLAKAYHDAGSSTEARTYLERAIARDPAFPSRAAADELMAEIIAQ